MYVSIYHTVQSDYLFTSLDYVFDLLSTIFLVAIIDSNNQLKASVDL